MQNKIKQENRKNGVIIIIILAVIFGLLSGIVGGFLGRSYMDFYYLPFFGEINFSDTGYRGSNLIIRDAKKVIVEQDVKMAESINSIKSSTVGIFKKITADLSLVGNNKNFDLDDYYQPDQLAGQGLIITSDGWIVANFFQNYKLPLTAEIKHEIIKNYAVVAHDKNIYEIDNIIFDSFVGFYFIHITSKDLTVKRFADLSEVENGHSVAAVDWHNQVWTAVITNKKSKEQNIISSSDSFSCKIKLDKTPEKDFNGLALFNLAGDIVGMINSQSAVVPISHFNSAIKSLLKNNEINRASLGVNYISLSDLIKITPYNSYSDDRIKKGALIYQDKSGVSIVKNSAADIAGLKEGDIIIMVDNININQENSLTEAIQRFMAGEKVKLTYFREGEKHEIEIKLGELK